MSKPLLNIDEVLAIANEQPVNGWANGIVSTGEQTGCYKGPADIISELSFPEVMSVHYVSKGAWSMHELLLAAIEISGKANLWISSYAMSETAARCLSKLKDAGLIKTLNCVIDSRVDTRTAGSLQLLTAIADQLVMCDCHAKVTLLDGTVPLSIVGSANYTENKRYETGIITKDAKILSFHRTWMQEAIQSNGNKL